LCRENQQLRRNGDGSENPEPRERFCGVGREVYQTKTETEIARPIPIPIPTPTDLSRIRFQGAIVVCSLIIVSNVLLQKAHQSHTIDLLSLCLDEYQSLPNLALQSSNIRRAQSRLVLIYRLADSVNNCFEDENNILACLVVGRC